MFSCFAFTVVLLGQHRLEQLEGSAQLLRYAGFECTVSAVEDPAGEIWCELKNEPKKGMFSQLNGVAGVASLRVFNDALTDEHLSEIKNLTDLHLLVVMSPKLTDQCTIPISNMAKLKKLDINKATLTRNGLERLTKLKKLERLYLYNCGLSDQDALVLGKLTHLKLLSLPTNLKKSTVSELKIKLPNTEIKQ